MLCLFLANYNRVTLLHEELRCIINYSGSEVRLEVEKRNAQTTWAALALRHCSDKTALGTMICMYSSQRIISTSASEHDYHSTFSANGSDEYVHSLAIIIIFHHAHLPKAVSLAPTRQTTAMAACARSPM